MPICIVEDCDRQRRARGYCITHYNRMLKGKPLDTPIEYRQKAPTDGRCTHPDCERPYLASGYCSAHWRRAKDGKDMDAPIPHFRRGSTAERFGRYVDDRGDGCWLWTGAFQGAYGQVWDNRVGKCRGAHVVAWELANDRSVPKGMHVCHDCDNPQCVRPDHLLLDTPQGNIRQKVERGRCVRGSAHGMSRLSEDDVVRIRRLYRSGSTQREVADQFGVSQSTIRSIIVRKTWTHI